MVTGPVWWRSVFCSLQTFRSRVDGTIGLLGLGWWRQAVEPSLAQDDVKEFGRHHLTRATAQCILPMFEEAQLTLRSCMRAHTVFAI
jgi:hypothetical protein